MRFFMILVWFLPSALWAQTLPPDLPAAVAKQIAGDPVGFYDDAAAAIWSYGQGGGIDQAAIDTAIAVDRARNRARLIMPFLQADLDGNGDIAPDELAPVLAAESARGRARLMAAIVDADGDGDGTVTAAEQAGFANARAAMAPRKLARMQAIAAFDSDGDARTTLAELQTALAIAP